MHPNARKTDANRLRDRAADVDHPLMRMIHPADHEPALWVDRMVDFVFAGGVAVLVTVLSHPPAGTLTVFASSGCGSTVQVWTASLAATSDCGSSRAATSSRFLPASWSPCCAASANHLYDSARFCSTPIPRA